MPAGTFQFDFFSLIFIAVVLIFMIFGLKKGFGQTLLYMVMPALILIVAIIAAQPVGKLIEEMTPLGGMLHDPIYGLVVKPGSAFEQANLGRDVVSELIIANDYAALTGEGIPAFLAPILTAMILPTIPEAADSVLIGEYVTRGAVSLIFYVGSIIIIFVVLRLILMIFRKIDAKKKKKAKKEGIKLKPKALSRLLGMIFGMAVGAFSVVLIGFVLNLFAGDNALGNMLNSVWFTNDDSIWTIGEFVMKIPVLDILAKIFDLLKF